MENSIRPDLAAPAAMENPIRPDLAAPAALENPIRTDLAAPAAMKNLMSLVNNLQRACTALGDHGEESPLSTLWDALPSIAVVGGQSSGKSSVLESFVGKDFLPRGSGIVTRRPLVLQLHRIDGTKEYAEFLHQPMERYTDFAKVRKEIADETDRETGRLKGISSVPIHLSIFSPYVVNLTLIDLPGLTKIAVDGQSDNTVQEIESMVRAFIEKPNCIILAVSPANEDLATSDAIKISREVDPKGERTFGVLTKIDLMDKGTDAVDILEGRYCQFQFPWIGVVNRFLQGINDSMDMTAARRRERDYFANTPEYKHLAHRMGADHLSLSLSKHLETLIKSRVGYLLTDSSIKSADTMKNRLQGYNLRVYGRFPLYKPVIEGELHNMTHECSVKIGGVKFISSKCHAHLKDAEEDVATVAFTELMGKETLNTFLDFIKKAPISNVNILKEYAMKKKLAEPLFATSRVAVETQRTVWISTVILHSRSYLGDVANSKKESIRLAAIEAVGSLLEDADEVMIRVISHKRLRYEVSPKKGRKHEAERTEDSVAKKREAIAAAVLAL